MRICGTLTGIAVDASAAGRIRPPRIPPLAPEAAECVAAPTLGDPRGETTH